MAEERALAEHTITYATILKQASLAHAARKLTDKEVGTIRAAGRQTELELRIGQSLLDLYRLGAVSDVRLRKSLADVATSIERLSALWGKYAEDKPR